MKWQQVGLWAMFALLSAGLTFVPHLFVHADTVAPTAPTETVAQLQAKYAAAATGGPKVKVLIVPGHEPDFGGTEFGDLKEREINVIIADQLASSLEKDPHLNVIVARDDLSWNTDLANYFESDWQQIQNFVTQKKATFSATGVAAPTLQASHNAAPDDVALRLYGITKWADENGVDMAIHIHMNDAGDHTTDVPGNNSGFAVYVPDVAFGNASTSKVLGTSIDDQLNHYNATSSLAIENLGVADDQELIALGAYNTASYASVLIEYAYIYESKILNPVSRSLTESDFAFSTYRGVESFFKAPLPTYDTLELPYHFATSPAANTTSTTTYALQTALHRLGDYPPAGEYYYDCPISGYMGACTASAIKEFQQSKGLEQTGALGPRTMAALNTLFSK